MFNFWDFDKEPEFVAIFKGQYKNVGKFQKNVYHFRTREKKSIHVWAYVQLNNLMYGLPFGTEIKVKYLGMEPMPDSKRLFKNFSIEVINPPEDGAGEGDPEPEPEK